MMRDLGVDVDDHDDGQDDEDEIDDEVDDVPPLASHYVRPLMTCIVRIARTTTRVKQTLDKPASCFLIIAHAVVETHKFTDAQS